MNYMLDKWGLGIVAGTFFFGTLLVFSDSGEFLKSAFAGLLSAFLALISYIILRWLILAFKRP